MRPRRPSDDGVSDEPVKSPPDDKEDDDEEVVVDESAESYWYSYE